MRQMREAMVDMDLAVVNALNRRLELAARLAAYQATHGGESNAETPWMRQYVASANGGPLSEADLLRLLALIEEICAPGEGAG